MSQAGRRTTQPRPGRTYVSGRISPEAGRGGGQGGTRAGGGRSGGQQSSFTQSNTFQRQESSTHITATRRSGEAEERVETESSRTEYRSRSSGLTLADCQLVLDVSTVTLTITPREGEFNSAVYLDEHVGNRGGALVWGNRNFSESCSNIQLEGTLLVASCSREDGEPVQATLDLDKHITYITSRHCFEAVIPECDIMATSLSLFHELTDPDPARRGFPVTNLLTELIRTAGHDVCLTKRNLHSMYWTVSRARDVCDTINGLAATTEDGGSWQDLNTYTQMIIDLEEILVKFSALVDEESAATQLPATESIQSDLDFIETWRTNRESLRETMRTLAFKYPSDDTFNDSSEIKTIQKHDDGALLKAISQRLSDHAEKLPSSAELAQQSLAIIRTQVDRIQTALAVASDDLLDEVVVYSMQTAMAVEIVASARDETSDRLHSTEFWTKATSIAELAETHASDVMLAPEPLQTAWAEVLGILDVRRARHTP